VTSPTPPPPVRPVKKEVKTMSKFDRELVSERGESYGYGYGYGGDLGASNTTHDHLFEGEPPS
jgi:hypothetical protein